MAGIINRVIMFVVLLLVQVLILNRVWLFNVATPLLYVYFVVSFPRNSAKGEVLAWSFALGLMVDLFSNTPGMASGTMTLVALLQPYLREWPPARSRLSPCCSHTCWNCMCPATQQRTWR